jgi:hypothetical protein
MGRLVGLLGVAATAAALAIGLSSEPAEVEATRDLTRWSGNRVRVEVLNGGGVPGMARAATDRLRDVGFDVVSFGNAASFDADRPSVVIDRVGHPELARAVAAGLGIDNVHSEPDPNLYVEVTVVLGGAWTPDSVPNPAEEAEDGPLWDPRTWFER